MEPDTAFTDTVDENVKSGKVSTMTTSVRVLTCCIVLCTLFFGLTNPTSTPALSIAGFVVLVLLIASSLQLLLVITGLYDRLRPGLRRGIVISVVSLPTMLLMLQSIGQLTVRDVITLGGLFLVGIFYINRVRKSTI